MRIPSWLIVTAAVIMAVPFGWALGVLFATLIVGRDVGVLPALTIPVAVIASIVFALSSAVAPLVRLLVVTAGTILFLFFW